jgi:hypothetical protein
MVLIAIVLVAAGLGVAGAGLYASRTAIASHAQAATQALESDPTPQAGVVYRLLEPLADVAVRIMRPLSPVQRLELTRQRIIYAGLEAKLTVEQILTYKAVAAIAGLLFGLVVHPHKVPGIVAGLVIGLLASFVPDVILDSRARERQQQIARGCPMRSTCWRSLSRPVSVSSRRWSS